MKPALLLLPNLIGEHKHHPPYLPISVDNAVASLDGLIAESERGGRRYLGRFQTKVPAEQIPIAIYDEHTSEADIDFLLEPIRKGERWGYVSDAGIPCVADPGSKLVFRARQLGIYVQAFVGPSSLLLALMLSGLPGQQFAFHGYLDRDPKELRETILALQRLSQQSGATQIVMERPYRSMQMLETLLATLDEDVYLCVAWELTMPEQGILVQRVKAWRHSPLPALEKKNALFLFNALLLREG